MLEFETLIANTQNLDTQTSCVKYYKILLFIIYTFKELGFHHIL